MAGLDGILLSRQAEGIKSHRVHDIIALHPLHSGHDIGGSIALRMAYMQTLSTGVGKHIEYIVLWLAEIIGIRPEGLVIFPVLLPLLFNRLVIVWHIVPPDKQKSIPDLRTLARVTTLVRISCALFPLVKAAGSAAAPKPSSYSLPYRISPTPALCTVRSNTTISFSSQHAHLTIRHEKLQWARPLRSSTIHLGWTLSLMPES